MKSLSVDEMRHEIITIKKATDLLNDHQVKLLLKDLPKLKKPELQVQLEQLKSNGSDSVPAKYNWNADSLEIFLKVRLVDFKDAFRGSKSTKQRGYIVLRHS
jgi:hypothetical protein